jgi:hypothetical protein
MNPDLGFALILALCALWCAYRMRGRDTRLPPPSPHCKRGSTQAVTH